MNQYNMETRKSKTKFTADERTRLISLVRELEQADEATQKRIRDKIRKIGLYWSEVTPPKTPYTVANLKRLFEDGTLKIVGSDCDNAPVSVAEPTHPEKSDAADYSPFSLDILPRVVVGRKASDEHYIIDLCDEILGQSASRQHRFDFLRGDTGVPLPVDAYYPKLNLVIEYYERQHTESTPFFDRKETVSGVSRGEQRRIYDHRRQELLPQFGIKLVIISYSDFGFSKKLVRNRKRDLHIVRDILVKAKVIS